MSGPVHQHESGFMEGSFHKEEPHSELTQETIDSASKITEFIQDILTDVVEEKNPKPDLNSFYHVENENESCFCIVDSGNSTMSCNPSENYISYKTRNIFMN